MGRVPCPEEDALRRLLAMLDGRPCVSTADLEALGVSKRCMSAASRRLRRLGYVSIGRRWLGGRYTTVLCRDKSGVNVGKIERFRLELVSAALRSQKAHTGDPKAELAELVRDVAEAMSRLGLAKVHLPPSLRRAWHYAKYGAWPGKKCARWNGQTLRMAFERHGLKVTSKRNRRGGSKWIIEKV